MDKQFSLKERLLLSNQYNILAKLSSDEDEKKQYENLSEVFRAGYVWGYGLATETILGETTKEECRFVLDTLDMYSRLYFSRRESKEAQEAIEEKEVLFKGFDLNDPQEGKYYSFYKFLVEDLNRFSEYKELIEKGKIEGYNSHGFGPSMETIEMMLRKAKEVDVIRHDRHDLYYTKEEIEEILKR
ncbi:YfbU family protein [Bacillus sp. JJ1474]|uniref:YfbU family protein n=1 Tax=Bacillus sp. JJ1474 TaxID=3122955 RepID=UPI002FFDEF17